MEHNTYVPDSAKAAAAQLRLLFAGPAARLPRPDFVRAWSSIAYLFPGLHPDGFDNPDSGWPRALRPIAAEAWRRAEFDELTDEELYPSDAQWAGLYDQMLTHHPDETDRRLELAAHYGRP